MQHQKFKQRIIDEFSTVYPQKHANIISSNLMEYFIEHQFDEWEDIVSDISNGYDNCCCKQVIYKVLKLSDISQKNEEYQRLRKCIHIDSKVTPQVTNDNIQTNNNIQKIRSSVLQLFTDRFDAQTADNILKSFDTVIEIKQYTDVDSIIKDINNTEQNSDIVSKILNNFCNNDTNQINTIITTIKDIIDAYTNNNSFSNTNVNTTSYGMTIDDFRNKIKRMFKNTRFHDDSSDIVDNILDSFNTVIDEEQFDDIETILSDIETTEDSIIIQYILDQNEQFIDEYDKTIISNGFNALTANKKYFIITDFIFDYNDKDIALATELTGKHSPSIYINAEIEFDQKNAINADKSFCISKTIDLKNGYPLNLWLLNTFHRDRMNGHKRYYDNNKAIMNDKYAIGYSVVDWWDENLFTKYISFNYPVVSNHLKMAVQTVCKRILPPLNFIETFSHIICDSLNAFATYTLAIHYMAQQLMQNMIIDEFSPIQLDFWIIPQCVKHHTINQHFTPEYLLNDNTLNSDDDDNTYYNQNDAKQQMEDEFGNSTAMYHSLSKTPNSNSFWDLEQYLNQAGFEKNVNYFVEISKVSQYGLLRHQLYQMWKEKSHGNCQRYKRYIFIIDRRNPENIKQHNMSFKQPKINKTEDDWHDKIFLIIPPKQKKKIIPGKQKEDPPKLNHNNKQKK
eukprot:72799_1